MSKMQEYQQEYIEFTKFDDFNMDERLKRIPAVKHSWISRLVSAKSSRFKLLKDKKKIKEELVRSKISDGIINLTRQSLEGVENDQLLEGINDSLQELDLLIEYLEHVVKTVSFIGQDMKNMIDHKRLELE